MSLRPPNGAERHRLYSGVVYPQPREDLTMKRFSVCVMGLVFAISLWGTSASAQDKFTMGMGGGT
jgi:hypothetical protein